MLSLGLKLVKHKFQPIGQKVSAVSGKIGSKATELSTRLAGITRGVGMIGMGSTALSNTINKGVEAGRRSLN